MSKAIGEIIKLVNGGWRPYGGTVEARVYEGLDCPYGKYSLKGSTKPAWFNRGDIFLCIGCGKKCSLNRPRGFQAPLPIKYPYDPAEPFTLTPEEMVAKKSLLTVNEAAYCLNISAPQVYRYVDDGRLTRHKDRPIRVPAAEVASMMKDLDE